MSPRPATKRRSRVGTTVAMDFGTYVVEGGDVRLLMFGTPGQRRFWFMTDIMKGEVDAVVYVIDAEAHHTHEEAGAAMRALLRDLRVPLVVAVNRCDDPAEARLIARLLGALASEAVLPCQLIAPESGREVVVEALLAVLDRLEQQQTTERPPTARPGRYADDAPNTTSPATCSVWPRRSRARAGSCSTPSVSAVSPVRSCSTPRPRSASTPIAAGSTSPSARPIRRSVPGWSTPVPSTPPSSSTARCASVTPSTSAGCSSVCRRSIATPCWSPPS